ncbi:MAG: hypothetical protein KDK02_11845 [Rhodobacteraceae bacterium]|nr:hypothetical protein [Paracoccaceae bacterium]
MFARISGAGMRGLLVALLVAIPSILLPGRASDAPEIVLLLAIIAAMLTFAEYNSIFPSYVEFRDAPPLNRMRFVALFSMVLCLTLIAKHRFEPTNATAIFAGFGVLIGNWVDFPYSPVRQVVLMLPEGSSALLVQSVRVAAGVSYVIALITVAAFVFAVRVRGWPTGNGAFNVWVNLPLFDPTAGGDVVSRLQRDGRLNVIMGVLLPFLIPVVVKAGSQLIWQLPINEPQPMIWTICAWAFLPASMILRGIAMMRIAELIEKKRRRTYANPEAVPVA